MVSNMNRIISSTIKTRFLTSFLRLRFDHTILIRPYTSWESNQSQFKSRFSRESKRRESYDENNEIDLIYGVSPIKAVFAAARRKALRLHIQDSAMSDGVSEVISMARQRKIPVHQSTKQSMNRISNDRPHQGLILEASKLDYLKMPSIEQIANLPLRFPETKPPLCIFLDQITDPQNLGAILRSAHFLGVDMITVSRDGVSSLTPSVSKASSGASELMEIYVLPKPSETLQLLASKGWDVIGTEASSTHTTPLQNLKMTKPTIIVFGSEGDGLRPVIKKSCTMLTTIQSQCSYDDSTVDSLNVSVAAGIILHHMLATRLVLSNKHMKV
eukprot:TRINITY_DN8320_c0_g1_i2.p1 TRINITY_DN8320_c0_g1~~TRINITY_DN8320_c0_g1_i2.p1  ORF type:complete len:329 (+),score=55.17 TRINITY_DN8320_c0_g1_i2:60-1046(+)